MGGRQPDNVFAPDESLFYRVKEIDERGKIGSPGVVLCPNTSVNRGKYSKPIHVLWPRFFDWHVLEMSVSDIPPELQHPLDLRRFQFEIVHAPELEPIENYAHSEIRAAHDQEPKKRLPALVEKQFRQILADRLTLVPPQRLAL